MRWIAGRRFWIFALLLSVQGCQFIERQSGEAPAAQAPDQGAASINPYLVNQPPVDRAAQQRFQAAVDAMKVGDWAVAEQDLQWLTTNYDSLSGPWLNLGQVYQQLGQVEAAEKAYLKAISVNANNLTAYNELAVFLRQRGRFDEAEQWYLKAIAVWPGHPQSHRNLGILYDVYLGRFGEALDQYQQYLSLVDTEDSEVQGWLIDLQRRINQGGAGGA